LERDYLLSWHAANLALREGTDHYLEDYWTPEASDKLMNLVTQNQLQSHTVDRTTIEHNLSLQHINADRSIAVFLDKNVKIYTRIRGEDSIQYLQGELANFYVVMYFYNGHWKIRHLEKTESLPISKSIQKKVKGETPIRGINYYPLDSPWDTFGDNFHQETIGNDFELIDSLGLNTVRIFVDYHDFRGPRVDPKRVDKLLLLLDSAQEHHLQVMITLFDFNSDYRIERWPENYRHVKKLVEACGNHPALWGWDLKNEPDLDFKSRKEWRVQSWLTFMGESMSALDSVHPITVGWSQADTALKYKDKVDVISFHHYDRPDLVMKDIALIKNKSSKEILIQEICASSSQRFWAPFQYTPQEQKEYYDEFLALQKKENLNFMTWTLYDFETIPEKVAGRSPWAKKKQAHFGILDKNGERKPAFFSFEFEQP